MARGSPFILALVIFLAIIALVGYANDPVPSVPVPYVPDPYGLNGTWTLYWEMPTYPRHCYQCIRGYQNLIGEAYGLMHASFEFDGDHFVVDRIVTGCRDSSGSLGEMYLSWMLVYDALLHHTGILDLRSAIRVEETYAHAEHVGYWPSGYMDRVRLEGGLFRVISSGTFQILESAHAYELYPNHHMYGGKEYPEATEGEVIEFTLDDGRSGIATFSLTEEGLRIGTWMHMGSGVFTRQH